MSLLGRMFAIKSSSMEFQRFLSSGSTIEDVFTNPKVQEILCSIAASSVSNKTEAAFAPQQVKRHRSKITLMTEAQYKKSTSQAVDNYQRNMQPFPVKRAHERTPPPNTVIQADPKLSGLSSSSYVLVDLSPSAVAKKSPVFVREPNGDIRTATSEQQTRLTNLFFPQLQPGRLMKVPSLFKDDDQHLQLLLQRSQYLYILKRACVQFEPDDHDFIELTRKVFDHLAAARKFETLDATPYFANLIFYCITSLSSSPPSKEASQKLCNLLVYLIELDRMADAARVLKLCSVVHPKILFTGKEHLDEDDALKNDLLNAFSSDSGLKSIFSEEQLGELNLSLQAALERVKEKLSQ